MTVRNKLATFACLTALLLFCWKVVDAQQAYPSTGVDGFNASSDDWAVSQPGTLDQHSGNSTEMSPDHWGSSASLENPDTYQTAATNQEWAPDVDSHPWLDKYEGYEPRQVEAQFAGQETENAVPLPPSSNNQTPTPAKPKKDSNDEEAAQLPSITDQSSGSDDNNSTPPTSSRIVPDDYPITPQTEIVGDVHHVAPQGAPCNCSTCTEAIAESSFADLPTSHALPEHVQSSQSCGCNTCRTRRGRILGNNRSARMWNDYQPNGARGRANHTFSNTMPRQRRPNRRVSNYSCDSMSLRPPMQPGPQFDSSQGFTYQYSEAERGGVFQSVFGSRNRQRRSGNSRWNALSGGLDSTWQSPNSFVTPSASSYSMANPQSYKPEYADPILQERYPTSSMMNVGASSQFPEVPVPPSMERNAPLRAGKNTLATERLSRPGFPNDIQPNYRPDLGHRSNMPTMRGNVRPDNGQEFGYEKEEFPGMGEIIAQGRFFGSVNYNLLKPFVQNNTSVAQSNGSTQAFDFDYEVAPEFKVGFESKYGPGIEFDYFQFDQNSEDALFTSDGFNSGTTSVFAKGGGYWTRLVADDAGESINADHSLEIHQFSMSFFKELKFKRSRLNGMFGLQYVSIAQELDATLTDIGGTEIGSLSHITDMRAYGPKVGFEYYRPVGHTPLALVSTFGSSLLYGNRDQFVTNTYSNQSSRVGADEFLSILDIGFALQSHRRIGETRSFFWRLGYTTEAWLGGGTAVNAQEDFGFRGASFAVGFNR